MSTEKKFEVKYRLAGSQSVYPCRIQVASEDMRDDGAIVVYVLIDPRTATVFYVGKTCHMAKRMCDHCKVHRSSRSVLAKRKIAIFDAGLCTKARIVHDAKTHQEAEAVEHALIVAHGKTLLNTKFTNAKLDGQHA